MSSDGHQRSWKGWGSRFSVGFHGHSHFLHLFLKIHTFCTLTLKISHFLHIYPPRRRRAAARPNGAPSKLTQSPVKHFNYVPAKCSFGDLQNWYIIRHPARGLVVIRGLPDRLEARIRCWSGGDRPPNRQKRRRRGSLRPLMRWRRGDFDRRSSAVPAFPAATATTFLHSDGFGDIVGREIQPQSRGERGDKPTGQRRVRDVGRPFSRPFPSVMVQPRGGA